MIESDPLQLCPSDSNLVQRYILAVLYFQMNGDAWSSCGQSSNSCEGDFFLSNSSECQWGGIQCNSSGEIEHIILDENKLSGSLPREVGFLFSLKTLKLDGNKNISGSFPTTFGQLSMLETLDVDDNMITGSLPSEIFSIQTLQVLDVDTNRMSGTIPSEIGKLTNLFYLQLNDNSFTGALPTELATIPSLDYLSMYQNGFSSIPPAFANQDIIIYGDCLACGTCDNCCAACFANDQ